MSCLVGLVSLGCAKNLVDSEIMLGLLKEAGFEITNSEEEAEVLIVNTCSFIEPAQEESIKNILELSRYKKSGACRVLLVCGCMPQRYGRLLLEEFPEVDGFFGTGSVPHVAGLVQRALDGERFCEITGPQYELTSSLPRLRITPPHTAYLKIAEGCSNRCAYCIIPAIRGHYRSRTIESIEEEARLLATQGVKEIILIAQDTSSYGIDLYGKYRLAELLGRLANIPDLFWLRLMYCSVDHFTRELIEVLAGEPKVCRYLDIPIQHASDEILLRMNRRQSVSEVKKLILKLRAAIPGLALRTTFMVGFPGESERNFEELIGFMKDMSFERAGVFKFYPEEGTLAILMAGQVPEEIKEERYHRAMALQQQISLQYNQSLVGGKITVLVDGKDKTSNLYFGRSEADSPEVDGKVYFTAGSPGPKAGDFVKVMVTRGLEYDILGKLV
ncbi:MAG: Ribosomal protein S12 methylthiotransferase RimO [Desulfotomaculum sp. 46_296]|nr:MAG: Ribosomal protein S12 methylthiotransferase RimO [Desulfotomaculum sp. 46_296]HAU30776.1 30S ribosomal protein S12 methylthiotransferase RimO [Desulfotomaculum sp.]